MEPLLGLMRDYGLWVCAAAVLLGALVALRLTQIARRLVHAVRVRRWTRRRVAAWGIPPTSACVPAYDQRAVALVGVQEADGGVRVGEVRLEVVEPVVVGPAPQVGDRVMVYGRLHRAASEHPRSYREASDGVWALAGIDGPVQCATAPRFAGTRRGLFGAALVGAMATLGLVDSLGAHALRRFRPPTRSYAFVSTTEERVHVVWTEPNISRALVALGSPRHRAAMRPHLGPRVGTQPVSLYDEAQIRRVVYHGLQPAGRHAEAARLFFAAGFEERALAQVTDATPYTDRAVCDFLREIFGPESRSIRCGLLRSMASQLSSRTAMPLGGGNAYLLANLARTSALTEVAETPPTPQTRQDAQDFARYAGQNRETLQCLGGMPSGSDDRELSRARTDAMLRSSSPACRILAATRLSRRDDESLQALNEIAATSPPVWRPLLDAARDLIVLEGAHVGRLRQLPPCGSQAPHGVHDPAVYARMPAIAQQLLVAAQCSRCAWMAEAIRLPAHEGILHFVVDAYSGPAIWHPTIGAIGAEWFGRAIQGYEDALAVFTNAARRDPRFDVAHERSLQEGLRRVRQTGVVLVARIRQCNILARRSSESAPIETPRTSLTRTLMQALGESPQQFLREGHQVFAAHTAELPPPLAHAVSQGDALDATAWVEVLRAADPDPAVETLRMRALPAARSNDTRAVLAALGAPTHHAVRAFADISPLLTHDRAQAVPWLRVSMTYTPPATKTLWTRLQHLSAIDRALHGLLTVDNQQFYRFSAYNDLINDVQRQRSDILSALSVTLERPGSPTLRDAWAAAVLLTLHEEAQQHPR